MSIIWKDVDGTNGMIKVNNCGEVMSVLRGQPKILKQQIDNKGYHRIRVTIDGKKMGFKVHRLVAIAFIDNPDGYPQVNHIDGNKDNNSVDNLEWVTNRQNAIHAIEHGLWDSVIKGAVKENNSRKKPVILEKDGEKIRFESVRAAESFAGRHVTDVIKGKRQHVMGWKARYESEVVEYGDKSSGAEC